MTKYLDIGARKSAAVYDAGVIQFIGDDGVVSGKQAGYDSYIRLKSG